MRLIDADETLMDAEHMSAFRCSLANMEDLAILVASQKTVDAVPVVRCRECFYWDENTHFCHYHSQYYDGGRSWDMFRDDDFCSYGERKEGADNEP